MEKVHFSKYYLTRGTPAQTTFNKRLALALLSPLQPTPGARSVEGPTARTLGFMLRRSSASSHATVSALAQFVRLTLWKFGPAVVVLWCHA